MPGALGTATTDLLPQLEVLTAIIVELDNLNSYLISIPQGPPFFNSCLNFHSSRASARAPSPWLVGILRAMATPDRRPETLTTSSSEQMFLV